MTATPTYKDIIGKRLAAQTKRNYESSIKQMREKLSESEKEEYLDSNGYLVKPLNHEVAARILHDSQLKVAGEGEAAIQKMKSQSCCVLYSSAMKFWHTESNRARDTAEASPIIISEDLKVHLSSYNTGRRRMTAEDRAKGDDIECEGKLPLDFDAYKALSRAAIGLQRSPFEPLILAFMLELDRKIFYCCRYFMEQYKLARRLSYCSL